MNKDNIIYDLFYLLTSDTLIYKIHVDKEKNVLMFCPICIGLKIFEIQNGINPESLNEWTRAECNGCHCVFIEGNDYIIYRKTEPPRSLRELINLNNKLSYYQLHTGTKVLRDEII